MFRDTSAQDRLLDAPSPAARWSRIAAGAALALGFVALVPLVWPITRGWFGLGQAVSRSRLTLARVERGPFVRDIAGDGKVVAGNSTSLYAPQAGLLTLRARAGDRVQRDQLLGTLESLDLQARLAQELSHADALRSALLQAEVDAAEQRSAARSQWESAEIELQTATNDLERQTKAFEAGATPRLQVEHARDAREKARIHAAHTQAQQHAKDHSLHFAVQAKRQALERQQLLVADLQRQAAELNLRSPVDGQVGQLFVAERASVARADKLLSIVDLSALEVQMQVAESFARELAIGMPGEINANGITYRGTISAVSPEVVAGEVAARLRFDDRAPAQLRQSQRVSVRVLLDRREQVLTLRRGSFLNESDGAFVYVVRGNMAEHTPIRLGARSLDTVEIIAGVALGDEIVVAGAEHFRSARAALSD